MTNNSDNQDPMHQLCRMVIDTNYDDLPDAVIEQAKLDILDTYAVTMGGSAAKGIPEIVDYAQSLGGKEESYIPFYGGKRIPAHMAALAIGPMTRSIDLGLVHEEAHHCAEYTLGAMLAALGLRAPISGKEFITAFVVGQEVQIRIGIAIKALSQGAVNHSYGGHFIFGVVAAIAKLLNFDRDTLENAMGIARGMTQPWDMAMFAPVTLTMRAHHGFLNQDAINACLLAKRGITGPRAGTLTGPRGFLTQFATWETDPEALTRDLGRRWEMATTRKKIHAACACTHSAADGVIELMQKYQFSVDDIANIHIDQCTMNWKIAAQPKEEKWNPQSEEDCQFSIPFVAATAAKDRRVFVESYYPEKRERAELRELMTRINVQEDSSLPILAARVKITLSDGSSYGDKYIHIKGSTENPFERQDYLDKFNACRIHSACPLVDDVADKLADSLFSLERVADIEAALVTPVIP